MITEIKKEIVSKIQRESVESLLSQGKRLDGRSLFEYRKIKVFADLIEKANGSALVFLGNTKVLVGVKVSVGEPFPDTPNEGLFIIHAELTPIASPYFELGPPSDFSIELARVVDRSIRSAEMIDLEKLAIIPGKKVWMLNIDIYPLDDDGNLIDASTIGVVAALLSTKLPKAEVVDEEKGEIEIIKDETTPLPIKNIPTSITFAKIGNYLIVDPTYLEENISQVRLTLGFTDKGEICSIQKGEPGGFKLDEIKLSIEVGLKKSEEIRKEITSQLAKNPRGKDVWDILFEKIESLLEV